MTTESLTRNEKLRPLFHMDTAMNTPSQFDVCGAPMTMTFSGNGSVVSFQRDIVK